MMKKVTILSFVTVLCVLCISICFPKQIEWEKGGPKYLYLPSAKKPSRHTFSYPYDENLKCRDCHTYDGVDAYTSATMTLKKSKVGRLPHAEIEKTIMEALKGNGDNRELYVLSTSFNDHPIGTCIEFTLDPKTFTFYASSGKQTEKIFHMAANPNVSMVYYKQRADREYFIDPFSVQIVGKAEELKSSDPGFMDALKICLSTMKIPNTPDMQDYDKMDYIKKNQIVIKVIPERIIITNSKFCQKGLHIKQIWESK